MIVAMDWRWPLTVPSTPGQPLLRYEQWLLYHYAVLLPKGKA
jgi:hypothetical protein